MGCKSFSQVYLNILNGVLLACSLGIIIYGAFLASKLSDFKDAINEGAILVPVIFGAAMFIVSIMGLIAVRTYNKILLSVYLVLALLVTIMVLSFGSVVLVFSGLLADINSTSVADASGSVEANVVDFSLAVYQKCCIEPIPPFASVEPSNCTDGLLEENCVSDFERFEEYVENIPESLCEFLEDVEIGGSAVIGPSTEGGCGGDDPEVFIGELTQFLEDNLLPLGIANIVLSALMLTDLITTCVLLWSSKDDFEKKKVEYLEKSGPDMANDQQPAQY